MPNFLLHKKGSEALAIKHADWEDSLMSASAILISELSEVGFGGQITNNFTRTYSIHFVLLREEDDLRELLRGKNLAQLTNDAVLAQGDVPPPDGTALQDFEPGHPRINSWEEALAVAKAARLNPRNCFAEEGLGANTDIYFAMKGQTWEKLA